MAEKLCPASTVSELSIDVNGDVALGSANSSDGCTAGHNGVYPVPDSKCTPGAYNPSVTVATLQDPKFTTKCLRNMSSDGPHHGDTYGTYSITKPADNRPPHMVCELDHLVPLELGGADTLDNIWPQCGPDNVAPAQTYWRVKDTVETCLADRVKAGTMDIEVARKKIAEDRTSLLRNAPNRAWAMRVVHASESASAFVGR